VLGGGGVRVSVWVVGGGCRIGQNRIRTPYITVYLVISLPKRPCIHRIYMVLANLRCLCVGLGMDMGVVVCIWVGCGGGGRGGMGVKGRVQL